MKVTVFGIGYVGLVQAAVLAEVGHDVVCVDVDPARVALLRAGEIPIYEPDLTGLVRRNVAEGRLSFSTDPESGVRHGDVQFIAVGTPPDEDGSADLRHVLNVAGTIGDFAERAVIVVNKSTVPVGTGDRVEATLHARLMARGRNDITPLVVSNPEFLKEGSAVADCMKPDRIIIGTDSKVARDALRELYAPFNRNHEKIIVMDRRSAELTKYAANCMLATKISFMNEMAVIADTLGADIEQVRKGIGSDPRIGYHFIYAGIGYGGSCFPKDVQALIRTAEEVGLDPAVLRAVETRNERQKQILFKKIDAHFEGELEGRTIALWGLAFKPNTDDMREAPSRVLMEALWAHGAIVRAYDPKAMEACARIYGDRKDLILTASKEDAVRGADALVIATDWKAFQAPDLVALRESLKEPVIFDGRNIFDPQTLERHGFVHYGVGRGARASDIAS